MPSGGSRAGGGSSTAPWYTDPYLWMNLAGTAGDIWASTSSAAASNRANVKLQREQRDWQEKMSNSEIQRRKADLIAAGGNPALAFTSGSGASSPSVAPPHVEPTYRGGNNLGGAAITAAQLRNINAQTENTKESTRGKTMTNNILNSFGWSKAETEQDKRTIDKQRAELEYDQAKELNPLAIKEAKQRIRNLTLTGKQTAQQVEQFERMSDNLVEALRMQVRAQEIDLDALENIAKLGGVEAGKARTVVQLFLEVFGNRKRTN